MSACRPHRSEVCQAVTAAFFLMLREGLEAALIVGIIAAYLVKIGRSDALPKIWAGVIAAVAVSVLAGIAVAVTVGQLPLGLRAVIEGVAALAAVVVLTWMLFWMRRQGRAMKGELESGVDAALQVGSTSALAWLAFIAVVREGLETALFLFAIGASSGPVLQTLAAAAAGLAVAVGIGWAIFRMGIRIDLRRFFTITGVVLIFVSAGLCAYAVHEFTEAGILPPTPVAFNIGGILPETSPLGSVLAGLFGYRSAPTVLELVAYLAYLIPVLILFTGVGRRTRPVATAAATLAIALIVAGCGGSTSSAAPGASGPPAASAGQTVEVTASEYKFDPATIAVTAGSVDFHVTNTGNEEHEFEIFKGETVVDEIEGLVPGLDRHLVVTLDAGDYTYVCKLPGHEEQGMKGTLTVGAS
jgi:high-affinity iron transporter